MSTVLKERIPALPPRIEAHDEVLAEVLNGMRSTPKRLPSKLFYDDRGAELFSRICTLPEYYLTRTELGILERRGLEIGVRLGERCRVIELGSGSGDKTRVLLRYMVAPAEYVPIDIAGTELASFARSVQQEFPRILVRPVEADFTRELPLPGPCEEDTRTLVFFPGSTIGNFEPPVAAALLRRVVRACGPHTRVLIGVDLRKSAAVLEPAYNDSAGVTAQFNLNMLAHINRRWQADFDLNGFRHEAPYNAREGRIEMHLVSQRDQLVHLDGLRLRIHRGERIVTEYSYKYTLTGFARVARTAGLNVERVWLDDRGLFSVQLLSR